MGHDLGADASFLMLASLVENSILQNEVSTIPLVTLLACCGAQSMAHDYEGGITAEPASLYHNSTDVLKQAFNYP